MNSFPFAVKNIALSSFGRDEYDRMTSGGTATRKLEGMFHGTESMGGGPAARFDESDTSTFTGRGPVGLFIQCPAMWPHAEKFEYGQFPMMQQNPYPNFYFNPYFKLHYIKVIYMVSWK